MRTCFESETMTININVIGDNSNKIQGKPTGF